MQQTKEGQIKTCENDFKLLLEQLLQSDNILLLESFFEFFKYSHTSPLRTNSFFNVARKTRVRKLRFFYTQKVMHKLGLRSYEKKIIINLKKEQ